MKKIHKLISSVIIIAMLFSYLGIISNAVEETTRSLRQRYEPIIHQEPRENINAILDGLSRLNDLLVRMEEASCSDSTNTSIPTKE